MLVSSYFSFSHNICKSYLRLLNPGTVWWEITSLVISIYLSSLPVAHLSDAPRRRLVVTGDNARSQDETTESLAWFLNVLSVSHRHMWPQFNVSSKKLLKILTGLRGSTKVKNESGKSRGITRLRMGQKKYRHFWNYRLNWLSLHQITKFSMGLNWKNFTDNKINE